MDPRLTAARPLRLFFSYSHRDEKLRARLETHLEGLQRQGRITGWHDRKITAGEEWEQQIDDQLEAADVILLLISADFIASKYCYDREMIRALERHDAGDARVVPIILRPSDWQDTPFGKLQALPPNAKPVTSWRDREQAFTAIASGLRELTDELQPQTRRPSEGRAPVAVARPPAAGDIFLETGAMPIGSPFFVEREAYGQAARQLASPQPTVTLKGYRQSGKSSLLVRLHDRALRAGSKSCYLNFQNLDGASFADSDQLFLELARMLVDELEIDADPDASWSARRGAKANFTRFMERGVLEPQTSVLLLFDEVDLAFEHTACRWDLFSMLRSWHNRRSEDLRGRWQGLGLVIAHATDPALWIPDNEQSPFNVGLRLVLEDFDAELVAELNRRHGEPLSGEAEVAELLDFVGGHPFLVRLALYTLVASDWTFEQLTADAAVEGGPFSPYLRRYLSPLLERGELLDTLRQILAGEGCDDEMKFQKLWTAGVIRGESPERAVMRCRLYRDYFRSRL